MGDVNSLKLTNDIFGHSSGDLLLEKVAEVMRGVCRADDIIARWGGDEFVLLLPKTGPAEAKRILQRIKSEVSAQQIRALSGSIAMGYDTKSSADEDITQTLNSAEANMYYTKTLERGDVQSRALDSIINDLTKHSTREKRHAQRVSELCESFGRALHLTKGDLQRRSKRAACTISERSSSTGASGQAALPERGGAPRAGAASRDRLPDSQFLRRHAGAGGGGAGTSRVLGRLRLSQGAEGQGNPAAGPHCIPCAGL
jgi:diguanylate cyclase (GGDEF)-like protein